MTVKIIPPVDSHYLPGKLADAELHFTGDTSGNLSADQQSADDMLAGLKLLGFAIWERRDGTGRHVTFPSRQYSVNGERRNFALLRPLVDATAQNRVRDVILQAYAEHEAEVAGAGRE